MPYPWIGKDSSVIRDRRRILDVVVLLSFTTTGGGGDRDGDGNRDGNRDGDGDGDGDGEETNTIKQKDNDDYVLVEDDDNEG